jgi:hypothetical protein
MQHLNDAIYIINEQSPAWAPEDRQAKLAPFVEEHGQPLLDALSRLSPEQRASCGVDEFQSIG